MLISEIWQKVEAYAPLRAAASWDRSGLQVASRRREAGALGVCLDPTPQSVARCLDQGAECILSHHPLSLDPGLPCRLDGYRETLRLLLGADVPLYAAHTSLDANPSGPSGWLARELGIGQARVLEETFRDESGAAYGFGQVGDLETAVSVGDIAATLAAHVDISFSRLCGPEPGLIRRLAYCTGSGSSLLEAAARSGAHLYITGDIRYHTALDAEICVLDVGHHSLEEEMMRRLGRTLQGDLPGCRVIFVPSVSPFYPLPGGA